MKVSLTMDRAGLLKEMLKGSWYKSITNNGQSRARKQLKVHGTKVSLTVDRAGLLKETTKGSWYKSITNNVQSRALKGNN